MRSLLVRNLEDSLVRKLKKRAVAHGVSAEEEHRRILRDILSRPDGGRLSLIEFLTSAESAVVPEIDLPLERNQDIESREIGI